MTNCHPNKLPMFCERSQAQTSMKVSVSSIDSTCLKHINQVVNSNLMKKVTFSNEALSNYDNIGKLAYNLTVQNVCDFTPNNIKPEDYSGCNVLLGSPENDSKPSNLQEEDPIAVPDTNECITYDASAEPSVSSQTIGESKLQIGSVYSLYDDSKPS